MRLPLVPSLLLTVGGISSLSAVEFNQTLYGETLVEAVFQDKYLQDERLPAGAGSTYHRDSSNPLWIRAKLGAKIQIEDRVETHVSVVYDAEYSDRITFAARRSTGNIDLNDANVLLRRFLLDDLHVRAGRQAVSWNLRRGHGAFLHDSRADNPTVTSWDGVRLHYNWDNLTFSPYHFNLNAARDERLRGHRSSDPQARRNNSLTGIHVDWQPEGTGEGRLFLTGAVSQERNPLVAHRQLGRDEVFGEKLWNYYFGFEWDISPEFTLWGEGALQEGRLDDDRKFAGYAYSGGVEWDVGGTNNAIIGVQYDHRSGDRDPSTGKFKSFVAPWEGISDAFIVEHERYGELSNLLIGNLTAIKAKAEYKFDALNPNRPLHFRFLWGYFTIDEPGVGRASHFGNEFDLSLSWQYNKFTSIEAFGGVFLPGTGYLQATSAAHAYTSQARDRTISLAGVNVNVTF